MMSDSNFYCVGKAVIKSGELFCECDFGESETYYVPMKNHVTENVHVLVYVKEVNGNDGKPVFSEIPGCIYWQELYLHPLKQKNYCISRYGNTYYVNDNIYDRLTIDLGMKVRVPVIYDSSETIVLSRNLEYKWLDLSKCSMVDSLYFLG